MWTFQLEGSWAIQQSSHCRDYRRTVLTCRDSQQIYTIYIISIELFLYFICIVYRIYLYIIALRPVGCRRLVCLDRVERWVEENREYRCVYFQRESTRSSFSWYIALRAVTNTIRKWCHFTIITFIIVFPGVCTSSIDIFYSLNIHLYYQTYLHKH